MPRRGPDRSRAFPRLSLTSSTYLLCLNAGIAMVQLERFGQIRVSRFPTARNRFAVNAAPRCYVPINACDTVTWITMFVQSPTILLDRSVSHPKAGQAVVLDSFNIWKSNTTIGEICAWYYSDRPCGRPCGVTLPTSTKDV